MKREVDGLTALDWAAVKGHNKIVDFLIKSGARFDESGTVAKDCKFCRKVDPVNMLRCLGCKSIHYCCAECQKSDWPDHKAQCKSISAMRENIYGTRMKA